MSVISPCPNCGHLCKDGYCSCGVGAINEKWYNGLLESNSPIPAAGPFTDLSAVVEGKRYLLKYRDRSGNVRLCDGAFKTVRNQRTGELLAEQWTHPHDMIGLICFPEDAIAVAELNGDEE